MHPEENQQHSAQSGEGAGPVLLNSVESLKAMVGQEFVSARWMRMEQDRVQTFAEATNDLQWIHLDKDRAERESPYGTTVAHGFLTLSLLSHFLSQAIELHGGPSFAINYGLDKVRFPAPVRVGEELRARFLLRSLTEVTGALQAAYLVTVEVRDSAKPCCVAEWIMRYYLPNEQR